MKCISVSYKILPYQISFGGEIIALEHNGGTALCPGALYIALMAHIYHILSMLFTIDVYWLQVYILGINVHCTYYIETIDGFQPGKSLLQLQCSSHIITALFWGFHQ